VRHGASRSQSRDALEIGGVVERSRMALQVGTPTQLRSNWANGGESSCQSSWGVQPNALLLPVKGSWQDALTKLPWLVALTLTCSNIARAWSAD
jgi:hypothetical protein